MRLLVDSGFFSILQRNEEDDDEVYDLTSSSKLLANSGISTADSLAPLVLSTSGLETGMAGQSMGASIKGDEAETPFHVAHGGKGVFEFAGERPEYNAMFSEALASHSRVLMRVVVEDWGQGLFGGLLAWVDVGGGSGGAAVAISGGFPRVNAFQSVSLEVDAGGSEEVDGVRDRGGRIEVEVIEEVGIPGREKQGGRWRQGGEGCGGIERVKQSRMRLRALALSFSDGVALERAEGGVVLVL
ncbi:hypothetical protein J5N97_005106 [Dioscorea zingiberensis]|uniref:O-methyltransferase C-terminal domain-containing protein n=1 Tax=Dioscorea zingiberensis TaxID=325984 RepID=A0A9D5D7G4_9LILI|nr:hypothetical protein J5N97_005106 [Dioscorea zingiberensis]